MKNMVLCCFPLIGKQRLVNHQQEFNQKIISLNIEDYTTMRRKRTNDELEYLKQLWEKTPHLLSSDGYVNRYKDELINVSNPDYPNNYIEAIKENKEKYDFVLVDFNTKIARLLSENNIEFTLVYPEKNLLYDFIGRAYLLNRKNDYQFGIKFLTLNWNFFLLTCDELSKKDNVHSIVIDKPGEFLSDVIKSYF